MMKKVLFWIFFLLICILMIASALLIRGIT